ncbi:sulfurtransferase TusA family protein [Pelagovum pacificum]|uniref:Sulfurtransferase TusA family protein n=1 Tax=Pelagovum pacificum TaxID=2588711 RepID=A0A5C5GB28_9RHOB|nr:sulfurtransferase TusA family protein [Pelagovum pacificum]QQA41346.1 sulfurtransferase TusA family protein [Pelagovum pacificum]TNY31848.1 sulfurtransferase TusA family protein [Pelagovum pacificum]
MIDADAELDATGLLCPLPVLKLRRRLQPLGPGDVIRVLADDPAAVIDIPHFCQEAGHEHVSLTSEGRVQVHLVRKG